MLPLLPLWFIYIAAVMRLFGGLSYVAATLRSKTEPNPVSWLLWATIAIVVFIAEIQAGVGVAAVVILAVGVSPLMVFAATIYKNPESFQLRGLNLICALIALAGIALWFVTKTPEIAISLMILADIASSLPTIKKVLKKPKSEFPPTFFISASSMIIALLAMESWSFAAVAYPIYGLIINLVFLGLTFRSPKLKRKPNRNRLTPKSRRNLY